MEAHDSSKSPSPGPTRGSRQPQAGLAYASAPDGMSKQLESATRIPELSELVFACRHHLALTLVLGTSLSLALVAVAWWMTSAAYKAESLVRVRQHQDVVFAPQGSRADDATFVRAQSQLVLSPPVLANALASERVAEIRSALPPHDAVSWLRGISKAEIQSGAEVLSISVQHTDPFVAEALANAVTEAYFQEITSRLDRDKEFRRRELEKAAVEADQRLDVLWNELNQLASQLGSDSSQSLTIRDEIQLQAYRDYAQQLRAAQVRGNELQSLLMDERLRQQQLQGASAQDVAQAIERHPGVVDARRRIADLERQILQTKEVIAQADAPRLVSLQNDKQRVAQELQSLIEELEPKLLAQFDSQQQSVAESRLTQLAQQVELNANEKEFLRSRMAEIDSSMIRTDDKNGVKLEMARHAVDRQTRLADGLWQSLEELKIEGQSQPRVTLIELAQVPMQANQSRRFKAAAGATLLAWVLAVLGVGYREWASCRIRQGADVGRYSTNPVFGKEAQPRGWFARNRSQVTNGAEEAAARILLTNHTATHLPSLNVTSSDGHEPRHVASLALARAFKALRQNCLIIDADVEVALLSSLAGADGLPGVAQVCAEGLAPRAHIVATNERGIDLLPSGTQPGTTHLIDTDAFGALLNKLTALYDVIIINAPALGSSAHALVLSAQADQNLISVFPGVSSWKRLVASEATAEQAGISVMGTVVMQRQAANKLQINLNRTPVARENGTAEERLEAEVQSDIASLQAELEETVNHSHPGNNDRVRKEETAT